MAIIIIIIYIIFETTTIKYIIIIKTTVWSTKSGETERRPAVDALSQLTANFTIDITAREQV